MANSAISTPIAQQLAGNIKNQDGSPSIYSAGVWTFENSSGTTTFTVSDAGAVTAGPANYAGTHTANCGEIAINAPTDNNPGLRLKENGTTKWVIYNDASGDTLNFYNGSTTNGSCSSAGAWTLGGSSISAGHTIAASKADTDCCVIRQHYSTTDHSFGVTIAGGTSANDRCVQFLKYDASTVLGKCTGAGAWSNISGGSWGTLSDLRLKKNIQNLENGLDAILSLRPVKYEWRDDNVSELRPTEHFIAQEVELVNPKWVVSGGTEKIVENGIEFEIENCKQVSLDASFNAYLVKAIQELSAQVNELKAEVAALKAK